MPESSNALFPDAQEAPETLQPLIDLPSVSEARLHRLRHAETRYEPPPHHNPNQLHQRSALPRPSRQTAHEALMPAESQRRRDQAGTVHHAWVMSFKKHATRQKIIPQGCLAGQKPAPHLHYIIIFPANATPPPPQ